MVFCDKCNASFEPQLKEIGGYQFFKCPECDEEYPVCRITPKGLKIRDKLATEREALKQLVKRKASQELVFAQEKKVRKLENRFKNEFTPLAKTTPKL